MQGKNETLGAAATPATAAVQTSLCVILILTGVLGNGIICVLVTRFKLLRTIPNILLVNLATVDLLNITINVPFLILGLVYNMKALNSKITVWWTIFLFVVFVLLNLTSMLLLVLDRYFALVHCFKYFLWRTRRKVFCAILAAWFLPVLSTGCYLLPSHNFEDGAQSILFYRIAYVRRNDAKYFIIPLGLALFTLIIVLSIITMRQIWKTSSLKGTGNAVDKLQKHGRRKTSSNITSASTILIVLLAYGVCFISGASFIRVAHAINSDESRQLFYFSGIFTMLCGSACNSFIYTARSSKFRYALKQTFKRIKCFQNQIHHHQKETGVVFYINGHFGKQQIRINNSLSDRIQGHYKHM